MCYFKVSSESKQPSTSTTVIVIFSRVNESLFCFVFVFLLLHFLLLDRLMSIESCSIFMIVLELMLVYVFLNNIYKEFTLEFEY